MSHNHYLECRACGVTTESECEGRGTGQPSSCFSRLDGGVEAVANAFAIREIYEAGIFSWDHHGSPLSLWAPFISKHAACNAFFEICAHGPDTSCTLQELSVKDVPTPACETCHGRRLVPCPGCTVCGSCGGKNNSVCKSCA